MIGRLAQEMGAPMATAIMAVIALSLILLTLVIFRSLRSTAMPDRLLGEKGAIEETVPVTYTRDAT